jgi:antirestriction protein ArdC
MVSLNRRTWCSLVFGTKLFTDCSLSSAQASRNSRLAQRHPLEPRADHVSYIANLLQVLKNDNRAIFSAASHAQQVVDFPHGLQQPAA